MSEVKHTPGPWYTGHTDYFGNGCADPLTVRPWHPRVTGGRPIADCWPRWNDDEQADADSPDRDRIAIEIGRANARLIAAAPDLLAACKAFVAWQNDKKSPFTAFCDAGDAAYKAATDAIAKAEGARQCDA
jgi:hypothetical protein